MQFKPAFTQDQSIAIKQLTEWYNGSELIFHLTGAAGSGKTYILNHLVNNIIRKPILLTASTHKAARIVEKLVNRKSCTLHHAIALRPNINLETFNIDRMKFEMLGEPKMKDYYVMIVDEASQISDDIDALCNILAKQYNTKILFVGDSLQLPPVRIRGNNKYAISKSLSGNGANLTTIVRQEKGHPLLEILALCRGDIQNATSNAIIQLKSNRNNIIDNKGYNVMSLTDFQSNIIKLFNSEEFKKDVDYVRYTAHDNNNINEWNKYIRNNRLKANEIVCENDLLVGYSSIYNEVMQPVIINSEDYVVEGTEARISDNGFKVYRTSIKGLYGLPSTTIDIVDHTDNTFISKFYPLLKQLHYNAIYSHINDRSKRWRDYYQFKNRHILMTSFTIQHGEERPTMVSKDIDYGYGLTVYKVQGSTYNNICINLTNIMKYKYTTRDEIIFRNKLIYVALSRAKDKGIILL